MCIFLNSWTVERQQSRRIFFSRWFYMQILSKLNYCFSISTVIFYSADAETVIPVFCFTIQAVNSTKSLFHASIFSAQFQLKLKLKGRIILRFLWKSFRDQVYRLFSWAFSTHHPPAAKHGEIRRKSRDTRFTINNTPQGSLCFEWECESFFTWVEKFSSLALTISIVTAASTHTYSTHNSAGRNKFTPALRGLSSGILGNIGDSDLKS